MFSYLTKISAPVAAESRGAGSIGVRWHLALEQGRAARTCVDR